MMHDDTRDLLRLFSHQPSRRALLQGFAAMGVGAATLNPLARALAAASDEEVAGITLMSQGGPVVEVLRTTAAPMFNAKYPKTAVEIEVSSATVTYPKMQATKSDPVISGGMFNDTFTARGVVDGMWAKLDPVLMPNAQAVKIGLKGAEGLAIPFQQTPYGIMYNPDKVEKPRSWKDLYKPEYKGRVSMWTTNMDSFAMAGVAAGKGLNVEAGIEAWLPYKQNIGAWVTSPVAEEELVGRGEIWLAPHWGAWAEQAKAQGLRVEFAMPEEGGTMWSNHACCAINMPEAKTRLTQIYLDTWFAEETQTQWLRRTFVSPTLPSVKIPEEMLSNPAVLTNEEAAKLYRLPSIELASDFQRLSTMITRRLKG
jgi:putative spermidine/putrescine transport system substrate-binding protein